MDGQQASSQHGVHVPFVYDGLINEFIIVQASINDQPPMPFVIDTGFNITLLIDRKTANQLKLDCLETRTRLKRSQLAIKQTCLDINFNSSDNQSKLAFRVPHAYVADLRSFQKRVGRPRIAGIIGAALLDHTTAWFDFADKTMTLVSKLHPPLCLPDTDSIPMQGNEHKFFINCSFGEGLQIPLKVDLGATCTCIPLELRQLYRPIGSDKIRVWLWKGLETGESFLLPQIAIGNVRESFVEAFLSSSVSVLGLDVLTRYRVILDFRNRLLLLQRRADYAERIQHSGQPQIHFTGWMGYYYIVGAKSTVAGAGLRVGDRLIEIDGTPVKDLSRETVGRLLNGFAGKQALLVVRRPLGRKVRITFTRPSRFDLMKPNLNGANSTPF